VGRDINLKTKQSSIQKSRQDQAEQKRKRILEAALSVFTAKGYAHASTLDIATRAKVSKRELYALVGNKQDMLRSCITQKAEKFKTPEGLMPPDNLKAFSKQLTEFGTQLLKEISASNVISVFRLAIAEAERTPDIAHILDSIGRAQSREILDLLIGQAKTAGLIQGSTDEMTETYTALLWGDLKMSLLLKVASKPKNQELAERASKATNMFLRLYVSSS
jgi:AcrR family transcriptional regulator